mmetsp:Transcript_29597/g.65320  ORF Transcript_29597/g.65320 Transcript_29597/m.65320 type:complete len:228 (-) Transcript_29597:858-1541(-)
MVSAALRHDGIVVDFHVGVHLQADVVHATIEHQIVSDACLHDVILSNVNQNPFALIDHHVAITLPRNEGVDALLHPKDEVTVEVPAIVSEIILFVEVSLPLAHDAVSTAEGGMPDVVDDVLPHRHIPSLFDVHCLLHQVVYDAILNHDVVAINIKTGLATNAVILHSPPGGSKHIPVVVCLRSPIQLEALEGHAHGVLLNVKANLVGQDIELNALTWQPRDDDGIGW